MKNLITPLILIFALPLSTVSMDSFKVKVFTPEVKKTSAYNYSVKVAITFSGLKKEFFDDTEVMISTEKYIITGFFPENRILESDLLFSQSTFDLNGDGDKTDSFAINQKSGRFFISGIPVDQIIARKKFNHFSIFNYYNKGGLKVFNLGNTGKECALYSIDFRGKVMTLGIHQENKIPFKNFPNPGLQIMVVKTVDSLHENVLYKISGSENHLSYSNEKIFSDQADSWTSIVWTVIPIQLKENKTAGECTIKNISPPFAVIAVVNMSIENGMRLRSIQSINYIQN